MVLYDEIGNAPLAIAIFHDWIDYLRAIIISVPFNYIFSPELNRKILPWENNFQVVNVEQLDTGPQAAFHGGKPHKIKHLIQFVVMSVSKGIFVKKTLKIP